MDTIEIAFLSAAGTSMAFSLLVVVSAWWSMRSPSARGTASATNPGLVHLINAAIALLILVVAGLLGRLLCAAVGLHGFAL